MTDFPGGSAQRGDHELVERLRRGDVDAFDEIVRSWSPGLQRVARQYVSTDASAQDVVQETWLAVVRGLSGFEGRSLLRTWVIGILMNLARKRGVHERRSVPMSSLQGPDDDSPVIDPSRFHPVGDYWAGVWRAGAEPQPWGPEGRLLSAELRGVLAGGLALLPARQRDAVVLRDLHDLDTEEVAEVLGLSTGNVRVLVHRGRMRLRQLLENYLAGAVATPGPPGVLS